MGSGDHRSDMGKTQMGMKEINDMDLIEAANLGLLINFDGYNARDLKNWPNSKRNYCKGDLEVRFRNGMVQKIELEGQLLRPYVMLNTQGFETKGAHHEIDFGLVHVDDHKIITVYLTNKSYVPGYWKIMYLPFPEKKYYGAATITK